MADVGTALQGQLALAGFTLPFDLGPFVEKTITAGQGMDYLYSLVIRSPQFKAYYPGIFRSNGTLKMTPAEYEAYADAALAGAAAAGFRITRAQIGRAIANNKSADEFTFSIRAAAQIQASRDVLNAFNHQLKSKGLAPIKTAQAAFDFLQGRGTKQMYDIYESASLEAAFTTAGLAGSAKQFQSLARQTAGVVSYEDARKAAMQLAADRSLGSVELKAFRLTVTDQEKVALGIADAKTLQRYTQAIGQRKANLQTQVQQQTTGVSQATGRPQLAYPAGQEPTL